MAPHYSRHTSAEEYKCPQLVVLRQLRVLFGFFSPVDKDKGRQNRGQGNNAWGARQLDMGELRTELGMQIQVKQDRLSATTAMGNGVALDEEQLLFLAGRQDNAVDEDVDEQPMHDLALNVDNMFQADDCDAFDFDVDEAPTA
ncbi:hypothetical protein Tco_1290656 [Tanacetum coccineum]